MRLLPLIGLITLLVGCAPLKPWERGRLGHECMRSPVDELSAGSYAHVEAVREGSGGGAGEGGGGCGCN